MITGNEPINPNQEDGWTRTDCKGLTIRQHFAAIAMQGVLSNDGIVGFETSQFQEEVFAKISVAMADALIKELNK